MEPILGIGFVYRCGDRLYLQQFFQVDPYESGRNVKMGITPPISIQDASGLFKTLPETILELVYLTATDNTNQMTTHDLCGLELKNNEGVALRFHEVANSPEFIDYCFDVVYPHIIEILEGINIPKDKLN